MKKAVRISIITMFLLMLCVCIYFVCAIIITHNEILDSQAEGMPMTKVSYDESYSMDVFIAENIHDSTHYVNVTIYDNVKNEVFCIRDEYRAFDFQWVTWEKESNNFWLKSGDIGTFYYEYEKENTWKKYGLRLVNKDQYVLEDMERKSKVYIDGEELLEKLPEGYEF